MNIQLGNSSKLIKLYTYTDLDETLSNLNSYNQNYQAGNDDIIFIRISMNIVLIIDIDFLFNRKLFELVFAIQRRKHF